MKAFASRITKIAVYIIATFIILFAVMVTVMRLITPVLDTHKLEIEKWASDLLGMKVTIQVVQVSWSRYQPIIDLKQVTVTNPETKQPVLQIQDIHIAISIFKSLYRQAFIPAGILIDGTEVRIHQGENGELNVQGFPILTSTNQPFKNEMNLQNVLGWLWSQPRLGLRNIEIYYLGFNKQKRHVTIYDLNLYNDEDQHFLNGKGILHQNVPTEISFALQWQAQTFNIKDIHAKAYLYVTGLSLPQWLDGASWQGLKIQSGIGSAKIWLEWEENSVKKIQSIFILHDLAILGNDKKPYRFSRISGNVGANKESNTYTLAGQDILIDLPHRLWPATNFYLSLQDEANSTLPRLFKANYLNIEDVVDWIQAFNVKSKPISEIMTHLAPRGSIRNIEVKFPKQIEAWQNYAFSVEFVGLTINHWNRWPGLKNITASIAWDGKNGQMDISSKRVALRYPQFFSYPVLVTQINGKVLFERVDSDWSFNFKNINAKTHDINADLNGNLNIISNEPSADLNATFSIGDLKAITAYLPDKRLSPVLTNWLNDAFKHGEVKTGSLILNGPLKAFPFPQNQGKFAATFNLHHVDLQFAPGWPVLKNLHGKLIFANQSVHVLASQAEIEGIKLSQINAEISNLLADQIKLYVKAAPIKTDFAQAMKLIHDSPLETVFGKKLAGMVLQGPMLLDLSLEVPLSTNDPINIFGTIDFENSSLEIPYLKLLASDLRGQLKFTENSVNSNQIQGHLFGKPMLLQLQTVKHKNDYVIQAAIQNKLDVNDIESRLQLKLPEFSGGAAVDTKISLSEPLTISFFSNLKGMSIDLPEGYGKDAETIAPITASLTLPSETEMRLQFDYAQKIQGAMIFNKAQNEFALNSMNLHLGKGSVVWPEMKGLTIYADFDRLNYDEIKQYISSSDSPKFDLPLLKIEAKIKKLWVGGQEINQAILDIESDEDHYDIDISSHQVTGYLKVPKTFTRNEKLDATFTHLHLKTVKTENKKLMDVDLTTLPALSFSTERLWINDMIFGNVHLQTISKSNAMVINSLHMQTPFVRLNAHGGWESKRTRLKGKLTSENISGFLSDLGFDVHNFIASHGNILFDLSWPGLPYQPSLESLNGKAEVDLGAGRIVEVGRESEAKMDIGKMLSIFSLSRLSTGFSDVFQKGYSFDSIKGSFNFKNGNAYTENLRFDGAVAKIGIEGRIGLKAKDFDLKLSVTAKVASSIPVAATLLTGWQPWFGLAALAANAVLGSQISKATTYSYYVRGPWDNPTWTPLVGPRNQ